MGFVFMFVSLVEEVEASEFYASISLVCVTVEMGHEDEGNGG